jgi:hypothetical protein
MGNKIQLTETELINLIEKMVKEYDKPAMSSFKKQYGNKKGKSVYYATANKQKRNPETFKMNEDDTSSSKDVIDYLMTSVDMDGYQSFDEYYKECVDIAITEYDYDNSSVIKKFCKENWLNKDN